MTSFSKKAKAEAAKYKHQISPKHRHKYTFNCGVGSKGFEPGNDCASGEGKGGGKKSSAPISKAKARTALNKAMKQAEKDDNELAIETLEHFRMPFDDFNPEDIGIELSSMDKKELKFIPKVVLDKYKPHMISRKKALDIINEHYSPYSKTGKKRTFASDCGAGKQGSKGFQPGNTCGGDGDGKNDAGDQGGGDKKKIGRGDQVLTALQDDLADAIDDGASEEKLQQIYNDMASWEQDELPEDIIDHMRDMDLIDDDLADDADSENVPVDFDSLPERYQPGQSDDYLAEERAGLNKHLENAETGEDFFDSAMSSKDPVVANSATELYLQLNEDGYEHHVPMSDEDLEVAAFTLAQNIHENREDAPEAGDQGDDAGEESAALADSGERGSIQEFMNNNDALDGSTDDALQWAAESDRLSGDEDFASAAQKVREEYKERGHDMDAPMSDEDKEALLDDLASKTSELRADDLDSFEDPLAAEDEESAALAEEDYLADLSESELEEVLGPGAAAPETQGDAPEASDTGSKYVPESGFDGLGKMPMSSVVELAAKDYDIPEGATGQEAYEIITSQGGHHLLMEDFYSEGYVDSLSDDEDDDAYSDTLDEFEAELFTALDSIYGKAPEGQLKDPSDDPADEFERMLDLAVQTGDRDLARRAQAGLEQLEEGSLQSAAPEAQGGTWEPGNPLDEATSRKVDEAAERMAQDFPEYSVEQHRQMLEKSLVTPERDLPFTEGQAEELLSSFGMEGEKNAIGKMMEMVESSVDYVQLDEEEKSYVDQLIRDGNTLRFIYDETQVNPRDLDRRSDEIA